MAKGPREKQHHDSDTARVHGKLKADGRLELRGLRVGRMVLYLRRRPAPKTGGNICKRPVLSSGGRSPFRTKEEIDTKLRSFGRGMNVSKVFSSCAEHRNTSLAG